MYLEIERYFRLPHPRAPLLLPLCLRGQVDPSFPRFNTPSRIYPLNPFRWPMSRDANYTPFSFPFLFPLLSFLLSLFLKNISFLSFLLFFINSTRSSIAARKNLFKFLLLLFQFPFSFFCFVNLISVSFGH